jgi:hypothetical protein
MADGIDKIAKFKCIAPIAPANEPHANDAIITPTFRSR